MSFSNYKKVFKLKIRLVVFMAVFSVLGLSAGYVFADWEGPTDLPPGGNIDLPVNTGGNFQEKLGAIAVGTGLGFNDTGFVVYRGKMGIGTATPAANLHINQNNYGAIQFGNNVAGEGMHISKTASDNSLKFFGGAVGSGTNLMTLYQDALLELGGQIKIKGGTPGVGKVLTSDASGLASWQNSSGGLPVGTDGQTLRHNGTAWVSNGIISNNGTGVGIGNTPRSGDMLRVWGDLNIANNGILKVNGNTGTVGQVLTKTASGMDWQDSQGGGSGGVDGNGAANYIPRWTDSDSLSNSALFQLGSNVGIGKTNPSSKLDVSGNISTEDLNLGNSGDGLANITVPFGGLFVKSQSSGNAPGSITFQTDGTTRMTIHEPNSTNQSLNGTVDVAKLRVQGAGSAGRVLTSTNSTGLVGWGDLSSLTVTSISAGAGIKTTGSKGNVTVSVAQGSWCGFSMASPTNDFDIPGTTQPPTDLCQGLDPVSSCPDGYKQENVQRINTGWSQPWVCIKN